MQGIGVTLLVTHKEIVPGYKKNVWLIKDVKNNTIALKNLIKKYRVTYNRINQIFVAHREDQRKLKIEFNVHEYGLHFYNTNNKAVLPINTVSGRNQVFTKRQISGADPEKYL